MAGYKLIGSMNLGNFRDAKIVDMENSEGDVEEFICIPIKPNGLIKRKTGIFCKLLISEIKNRLFYHTHILIAVKPRKNYKSRQDTNEEVLQDNIILGNAYAKATMTNYDNIGAPPVTVKKLQNMDFGDDNEVDV